MDWIHNIQHPRKKVDQAKEVDVEIIDVGEAVDVYKDLEGLYDRLSGSMQDHLEQIKKKCAYQIQRHAQKPHRFCSSVLLHFWLHTLICIILYYIILYCSVLHCFFFFFVFCFVFCFCFVSLCVLYSATVTGKCTNQDS